MTKEEINQWNIEHPAKSWVIFRDPNLREMHTTTAGLAWLRADGVGMVKLNKVTFPVELSTLSFEDD